MPLSNRSILSNALFLLLIVAACNDVPSEQAGNCFPPCSTGYVCNQRTVSCVTCCNPSCSVDQRCTLDCRCVSYPIATDSIPGSVSDLDDTSPSAVGGTECPSQMQFPFSADRTTSDDCAGHRRGGRPCGIDYPATRGTNVYAPIGGTIVALVRGEANRPDSDSNFSGLSQSPNNLLDPKWQI